MHPHSKHQSLYLTPRTPWGRLPVKRALQGHMRASEDSSRELPEEDKDGRLQGKVESTGEAHGKPETYLEAQVNLNPKFKETANYSDPNWEGREKLKAEQAAAQLQKEKEKKRRQSQQQVQRYVNTAMSAVDDGEAFLKQQQQPRPAR